MMKLLVAMLVACGDSPYSNCPDVPAIDSCDGGDLGSFDVDGSWHVDGTSTVTNLATARTSYSAVVQIHRDSCMATVAGNSAAASDTAIWYSAASTECRDLRQISICLHDGALTYNEECDNEAMNVVTHTTISGTMSR